jgi:hypothetical protein
MPSTELIIELLKKDLSAPRVMLEQVANYLNDRFETPSENLAQFFAEKFPTLEDYEVDLAFSPQYTPAWNNRLEYIPLLGPNHLSAAEVAQIKDSLANAKLTTRFKAPDSEVEADAPVHEVFIDRYVGLLKLELPIAEAVYHAMIELVPQEAHNEVNLLAREDMWQSPARQQILIAFLKAFKARQSFSIGKISFLTNFIRTYRPASLLDLERQFDSLIESCRNDMENVAGRGFHDEYLKAMNEDNTLRKGSERGVWDHYHLMMDNAQQLKQDFQVIPTAAPEIWQQANQPQAV